MDGITKGNLVDPKVLYHVHENVLRHLMPFVVVDNWLHSRHFIGRFTDPLLPEVANPVKVNMTRVNYPRSPLFMTRTLARKIHIYYHLYNHFRSLSKYFGWLPRCQIIGVRNHIPQLSNNKLTKRIDF